MHNSFSYGEYIEIIKFYKQHNHIMDFADVSEDTKRYCVIRHDVEFSVDRALQLAKVEALELNINTSYLFQIRNNCYNIASDINIEKLYEIQKMGHKIGVHIHLGLLENEKLEQNFIEKEVCLFENITGIKVDRFSYHRPTQSILKKYIEIDGLVNCYSKMFFHYYETPHDNLEVKYFTDSRHLWQHGHPKHSFHEKVQILTHPYSWSHSGLNNYDNYKLLLEEKDKELRYSIDRETSTFPSDLK